MTADNNIYLQLKPNASKEPGQTLYLKDIANISCSSERKKKIEKLVVLPEDERGFVVVMAVDIIEIIRLAMPSAVVSSVGDTKVSIETSVKKKSMDLLTFIKVAITCVLLFLGSGLAIMYFHEDVNMHEVHRNILLAVTGENNPKPFWLSIPYSIGIGVGISLFFGVFPSKKNIKTPDPLKIGMYQYKQDINSYLESEMERRQEE